MIFVAFYCVALIHHCIFTADAHLGGHLRAGAFAAAANPALHDSMKVFVEHILVYSGYVIPQH